MKKILLCTCLLVLLIFAGCEKGETPQNTARIDNADHKPLYSSTPYAYVEEAGADTDINSLDWEAILSSIPATYYEEYPKLHSVPVTATLYKDGKETELDINDPRLVRLLNFYNNAIHHGIYSYTQGSFNPTDLEELENERFRLVLAYTPVVGNFETTYDTIIVINKSFVGIRHNIPFGEYPSSAFGRLPLHADYHWLDLFGF